MVQARGNAHAWLSPPPGSPCPGLGRTIVSRGTRITTCQWNVPASSHSGLTAEGHRLRTSPLGDSRDVEVDNFMRLPWDTTDPCAPVSGPPVPLISRFRSKTALWGCEALRAAWSAACCARPLTAATGSTGSAPVRVSPDPGSGFPAAGTGTACRLAPPFLSSITGYANNRRWSRHQQRGAMSEAVRLRYVSRCVRAGHLP